MIFIHHTPKCGGLYLITCLTQQKFWPLTKPDRRVEDVWEWVLGLDPRIKAVSSHWAFHPSSFTPRKHDIYVLCYRPMEEVVFSMWDYLKGPAWAGRCGWKAEHHPKNPDLWDQGRRRAITDMEEAFHWTWHPLLSNMLEARCFEEFLWMRAQVGIPDLAIAEGYSNKASFIFNVNLPHDLQFERLGRLLGREIPLLEGRVNAAKDTEWRDEWRTAVSELIIR